ncbi:hypothetical protein TSAR_001893 [Trichomalopsis sarcophagae]|uniref:Uncharacterized protein n=1 Tax=Trichomalopsis sarcophagae TaxID=543379 RepID=A0A232FJK5_9HYME|nr:hypothetical protein TSAR_001893 [Trichomalopsis sarcophagae]
MGKLTIEQVFFILKPECESFMSNPSAKKAMKIAAMVNRTSKVILQKFYENILFPITHHLKNNTLSTDENLELVKTIRAVLCNIRVENLLVFVQIYNCLRCQICQEKSTMELIEAHEELKEAVVLCLKDLVESCALHVIESFYTRQHAALLSHGIYLCVRLARLEKSNSLRLAAIEAVMALVQVHDKADSQDIVLRSQIADVVMLYLPGVSSGLLEVALGSDIQNHKVTMMAIQAWSRAMALVMQDMPQEEDCDLTAPAITLESIMKEKDLNDSEKMKRALETTKRTPRWYSAVSEKFKILFKELDVLSEHSHFKVRKELAVAVSLLLLNCSRNMKPCFQTLLEVLITLSEDENQEVSKMANDALQKVQEKCLQDKNMKTAVETLEENLYELLTKLPRIIRTSGESVQIMWLNRLAGYLKVLGKQRLSRILLSTAHLRKLLVTLVYIAELDSSTVSLLEDITTTNFEDSMYQGVSHSWKQFKFLFDVATSDKLYTIFRILGEFGDHKTLVDSILKMSLDVPKFKKELTLILNTILEVPRDTTVEMPIYKKVVEHYINPDYWNLPVKVSDEITLQTAQSNIVQCCLILEGLGIIAKVLKENYQCFLLKTLYLVIERAGSKNSLIRFLGLQTLEIIAKSQNLETIGDLLRVNFDYISYHVTVKLRRVERSPGVLDVVEVVTNYSTMDFLPHLKDIVDDLLLQSCSNTQKRNVSSFLKVFYAFVICVKRLTLNKDSKENDKFFDDLRSSRSAEIVINSFLKYYNAKKDSLMINDNDKIEVHEVANLENNYDNVCDFKEDENEVKAPYFVNMIKDIMKRCLHFLPSQEFTESSLSMSILKEGAIILKDWENELLPIVHELWHPLVERFQNPNPLVINLAWQLLCCLAQVSQDFIRSRTLKQIFPPLSKFLKNSSKESYKKDSGSTYKLTQIFKLQKEILNKLGGLIKYLKLLEKDTWDILDIAEPYLDSLQHTELQEYCVNMYKEIAEYNADIVWIKCVDIWHRQVETVTPQDDLNTWYSTIKDCNAQSTFRHNVQNILVYIYDKQKLL